MRFTLSLMLLLVGPLAAAEPKIQRDIPYTEAKHERQMLDVYAPQTGEKLPIVFWIHGGGWQVGDKRDVKLKPQAFVDRGYVFVATNYRFVPQVTIQEIAGDIAKSLKWVHEHAAELGGDPNRILIMGHSAGAQLAALIAVDDRYLKAEGLSPAILKACVPVDGDTYDVPLQIATVEERRANIYRQKFGDEKSQIELSAVAQVSKGKQIPPVLILYVGGHRETGLQSNRLVKTLTEAGYSAQAFPAEHKTHTTIDSELGAADDKPTAEMFQFVEQALRAKQ